MRRLLVCLLFAALSARATDYDRAKQLDLALGTNAYPDEIRQYFAALDAAFGKRDYQAFALLIRDPGSTPRLLASLDWGQGNMMMGAGVVVPALYAEQLWSVGSAAAEGSQYAALKETAATVTLYSLAVMAADGPQCADQAAPSGHFARILSRLAPVVRFLAQLPDDRKLQIIQIAVGLEAKTAPLRGRDDYLCRLGQGEPKYLADSDWRPRQAEIRGKLPTMLASLLN